MELYREGKFVINTIKNYYEGEQPISYGLTVDHLLENNGREVIVFVRVDPNGETVIDDVPDSDEFNRLCSKRDLIINTEYKKRIFNRCVKKAKNIILNDRNGIK